MVLKLEYSSLTIICTKIVQILSDFPLLCNRYFIFLQVDPTENLTFNLKLTDNERQARSNLKLPYMYHEEKKSEVAVSSVGEGKVFYQPDEADDFDEDDPDEDLNI